MKHRIQLALALLVGGPAIYGGWAAWRAHQDLVSLNVRNMDVREVVKKIEWQTWESISVHREVQGKVTMHVVRAPLEAVLHIISAQVSSRWEALYPLYSSRKSLAALKSALRGETDPSQPGWTNLPSRGFGRGGPMFGRPFGPPEALTNRLVSLELWGKDAQFAALAVNRFAQARVVPEDGTTALVNLVLKQAPVPEAVSRLAKEARRKWTKLYVMQGGFGRGGPGGPPSFAGPGPGGPGGPERRGPGDDGGPFLVAARESSSTNASTNVFGRGRGRRDDAGLTPEQRDTMRQQREAMDNELKQVLPPEERQRLEAAQQQRDQMFQEMQNLTPEQRHERFGQMGGGMIDQRNRDRLRNTTPEQRAQQYQQMRAMRQRFDQRQAQAPPQPSPSR